MSVKDWQGIRADTAPTAQDGALFAMNPSFGEYEGELGRRSGMQQFGPQSGLVFTNYFSAATGFYVIYATATGTVEVVGAS